MEKRNEHRQILLSIKLYLHLCQMHRNSTSTQSTRDCIPDLVMVWPAFLRRYQRLGGGGGVLLQSPA